MSFAIYLLFFLAITFSNDQYAQVKTASIWFKDELVKDTAAFEFLRTAHNAALGSGNLYGITIVIPDHDVLDFVSHNYQRYDYTFDSFEHFALAVRELQNLTRINIAFEDSNAFCRILQLFNDREKLDYVGIDACNLSEVGTLPQFTTKIENLEVELEYSDDYETTLPEEVAYNTSNILTLLQKLRPDSVYLDGFVPKNFLCEESNLFFKSITFSDDRPDSTDTDYLNLFSPINHCIFAHSHTLNFETDLCPSILTGETYLPEVELLTYPAMMPELKVNIYAPKLKYLHLYCMASESIREIILPPSVKKLILDLNFVEDFSGLVDCVAIDSLELDVAKHCYLPNLIAILPNLPQIPYCKIKVNTENPFFEALMAAKTEHWVIEPYDLKSRN
ncbi:MAG: hypothetical protein ACKVTZ_23540 [Bacteroidia bacterium]